MNRLDHYIRNPAMFIPPCVIRQAAGYPSPLLTSSLCGTGGGQWHKRLYVRSACCPVRPVGATDLCLPSGHIPVVDRTVEKCQCGKRLVVRDFVPGLVDPGERKVPILSRLAVFDTIHNHGHIARRAELIGVLDGK